MTFSSEWNDMNLNTHNGRADPMEVTVENSEMESIEEMEGPRVRNGRSYDEKGPVNVYIANDPTIRQSNGSAKVEEVMTPIHPGQERDGGQTPELITSSTARKWDRVTLFRWASTAATGLGRRGLSIAQGKLGLWDIRSQSTPDLNGSGPACAGAEKL
ncbi:hypothetical protein LTR56_025211 [Elasticomyces elasticus]|nr:hypothetical protein LTR22_027997 [Elasticomyces elasticus]KAK3617556.1 hypothetical protein LTR56_025211 [Elasticomyces elasticus]